jgi:hypothetical protein
MPYREFCEKETEKRGNVKEKEERQKKKEKFKLKV